MPRILEQTQFQFFVEQFAEFRIGRFQVPGFEQLSLKQKEMLYYLYQAALSGRDIIWDQHYQHNLKIRKTLEAVVKHYKGDRLTKNFKKFMEYTKQVWFSNGIHHPYSMNKIMPGFPRQYFAKLVKRSPEGDFPLAEGETLTDLINFLTPILFTPDIDGKRVSSNTRGDLILDSANNFYAGVSQKEVEDYYARIIKKNDPNPISYGLNSKMVKEQGRIKELTWRVGGLYTEAIEKILYWLGQASSVSENQVQKKALDLLIKYYQTGDLKAFDEYNIAWIQDTDSLIDVMNGFIETYGDPLGYRGSYESVASFRDEEASRRAQIISQNARWFEDHSPTAGEHKKKEVKGISARVITVVALGGDSSPKPPLGINLPNANWIREKYGSKSVTLGNISHAYERVSGTSALVGEYAYSPAEAELYNKYGALVNNLHTDMHEIIGHASGQVKAGVGMPAETLKNYASVIEESRADLVALYYFMDPKLVELGLIPCLEVGQAAYDHAVRNGFLQQLTRVKLGENIEQAHMRNRQLVVSWAMELGKEEQVIKKKKRNGKTYFVINDYQKLRTLFSRMLREMQRITSEGDFAAAQSLVETYGVKVDYQLHKEVLNRFKKLGLAPYTGFICPLLLPVMKDGKITDIRVEYPTDFSQQMLYYAENYSFLPFYPAPHK